MYEGLVSPRAPHHKWALRGNELCEGWDEAPKLKGVHSASRLVN